MKKRKLLLPILLLIGLVSCGSGNNQITTGPSSTTSETLPTTPVDTKTNLEKLHDFILNLQINVNYTISITDSDGEWVRKYLPNAYYYYAPDTFAAIDNIGYAENENGIFAYKTDDTSVKPASSYYKDEEGNNLKKLYETKTLVSSWDTKPVNFANSFALFDINSLESVTESEAAKGMFDINAEYVIPLLPQMHQQNYYNSSLVRARLGLTSYGLLIQFNGSYVDYDMIIKDVGTTSIPFIEEYLESGQGPLDIEEDTSDTKKLKSLLDNLNYRVIKDEISYLVTSDFVLITENESQMQYGYLKIKNNNTLSKNSGIYEFTIDNSSKELILGNKTFYSEINNTNYAIPSSIFDESVWSDRDYVYTCENEMTLLNFTPYINEEILNNEQFIGKLYISYNLFEGEMSSNSSITFVGEHYDYNKKTATGDSTTLIINGFNSEDNLELGSTVIEYLNLIHN